MTKAKRMLSLLLAVIMILSVIPITASAAEHDGTTGGIKTHKEYNEETGYLTLEAYVTGESQTQVVAQPVDIALVLDTSASMENKKLRDDCISFKRCYHFEGPSLLNGYVDYKSYYIQVGDRTDLSELDTVYGANEDGEHPVYFLYSVDALGGYDALAKMRYSGGRWEYYGWSASKSWHWRPTSESNYGGGSVYISKLDALKVASKHFIDTANASSDPDHPNRISLIQYATDSSVLMGLTDVTTNASTLKATIDSLTANGGTCSDKGMTNAQNVLTDKTRKRVAIMFTDGNPGLHGDFDCDDCIVVANNTIKIAGEMEHDDVVVYTVGCFASNPDETSNIGKYMNYVSSNYPDAVNMNNGGEKKDSKYFKNATTSTKLTEIFQSISQEVGGASVKLESSTVLKDTISGYFDLDESVDDSRKITVHTETCTAINADGNPTAWDNDNNPNQYKADVVGKTITVTGFNYSANWVGSHNGQPGGKKIVLRIPIKPIDSECWGENLPTNDGANSGIYVGETPVAPFPVPTVNFPYYEIVHVRMGADGKLVYTGDLSNAVIADPTAVNADNRVRMDASTMVNLTEKVPTGYLYGGSFSDPACTTAWSYGTESAKSFRPQSGATYYIWEAPVDYLVPKSLSLSKTIGGQPNVIGFYLLTGVDRLYYRSAGFDVTNGDGNPISITDVGEPGSVALNGSSNSVYRSLTTKYTNGTSVTYKPGEDVFAPLSASSYLACFSVPDSAWKDAGQKVVFTPYWITLDGMKVTGIWTRTCQSDGPGSRVVRKIAETESGSTIMPANTAVQMLLTACGNVAVDGSENAPSASVDPIDPIDPVVPIDPIDPVTPVDPVEPAKQFSVTVYDGGSVYTLSAEAGEDISSRLVSAGMHGMRFAGWFLDERSTAAAELKNVQGDMDVYAKYVSDTYLTLRYRNVGLFRSRNVKLYAALDSADYAEAGFVINGKAVSCPITKDAYTAFFLYGSTVREDNTLVSYTYGTSDLRYGDTVEITPYWVTLDGTTVYGTTQTLTYGRFGLM